MCSDHIVDKRARRDVEVTASLLSVVVAFKPLKEQSHRHRVGAREKAKLLGRTGPKFPSRQVRPESTFAIKGVVGDIEAHLIDDGRLSIRFAMRFAVKANATKDEASGGLQDHIAASFA